MDFIISTGNTRRDKHWKKRVVTWDEFVNKLSRTTYTRETQVEYHQMKKKQQDDIKDVGGYIAAELKNGSRKNEHIASKTMLSLDADYLKSVASYMADVKLKFPYSSCTHSTHSHTPDKPRLRTVAPFSRPVSADEYQAISRMLAFEIGLEYFDEASFKPSQFMYWPSTPSDGEYVFEEIKGPLLDPDSILAKYHNWKDITSWPGSSGQGDAEQREKKKQQDPLSKAGLIGAFCRSYSIRDAIETFLSEVYEPSAVSDRYDYIPADSSAGVWIEDDKFSFSHHSTDPAYGMMLNAFDLVRIHRFRNLDDKCNEDTPVSKLPSYKAMMEFASKDEKVKLLLIEERQARAKEEFSEEDEWQKRLEYESRSTVLKNNLHNITLILQNDPKLKSLVFNQQLDGMEIKGSVPWNHPSKYWRDADDAQLISYIDSNYGTFSQRNYQIAVAKVTDDRSYHPIREYLDSLPEWDKVPRVDTLLIDYLGADDNKYVRAVTRKTLCAAISRVQNPGCKFDSMLVLNGPQGVGKSTLISKLAGEWFSDSLNLGDTKDKTAAEKLQGYWILEIGELAGLRKAEVETLRSFLSRQNDIYRAAFGKRATPHLRQWIFFGTTNAESGYLRDTTGYRRFWPVKTPGNGCKKSWEISNEEIQQIWAEALVYVKAGEKLYLDASMEQLAKDEQRDAMESDEREGLVREYLDTLLPEDWDKMDLFERRNFLSGNEFGAEERIGTVRRSSVCNMEIWCECFGKDRANLGRADSNNLSAILIKLGWSRRDKKERTTLYGPQYIYVPKNVPSPVPEKQ